MPNWSDYPAPPVYLNWTDTAGNINVIVFDVVTAEDWAEGSTITEHPVEKGANVSDHVRVRLPACRLQARVSNEPIDANNFGQPVVAPLALNVPSPNWVPGPGVVIVPTWVNPIELRSLAGSLVGLAAGPIGGIAGGLAAGALLPGFKVDVPVQTNAGLVPPVPSALPVPQVLQWISGGMDFVAAIHTLLVQLKNSAQLIDVFGTKQTEYDMAIEELTFHRGPDTGTSEDITIGLKKIRIVSTQTVAAPIPNLSAGGGLKTVNKGAQDPSVAPPAQQKQAVDIMIANGIKNLIRNTF